MRKWFYFQLAEPAAVYSAGVYAHSQQEAAELIHDRYPQARILSVEQ